MQNIKVNKKYLAFPHFETSELFTKLRRNDKLQTEIGKSTKLHIAQDYVYIVKWWKMKNIFCFIVKIMKSLLQNNFRILQKTL